MKIKKNPLVLEISARMLIKLAPTNGTFTDIPDEVLISWESDGYDAVWVMGVWTTGAKGLESSRNLTDGYGEVLPDWVEQDIIGSPYAIKDYKVHPDFGGDPALASLRKRMAKHNIALILDFVPNHTAPDHPWVTSNPEYYVSGNPALLNAEPANYAYTDGEGSRILAYGRDPFFSGWADTFQLDYRRKATRQVMQETLSGIAYMCDAVRCDMAMLVFKDIFTQTWGRFEGEGENARETEFWAEAIDKVHATHPDFQFIAEAYWDLEERLQLLGFDYTYHKSFYDHLEHNDYAGLSHDLSNQQYNNHSVFFIENHDEPRAASSFIERAHRHAAAFLTLTLPGMRLVHDGQTEARQLRHSIHLNRRSDETPDTNEKDFYQNLFKVIAKSSVGAGTCSQLAISNTAGHHNSSGPIIAILWKSSEGENQRRNLVLVNLSREQQDGHVRISDYGLGGRIWRLDDMLSDQSYRRNGTEMSSHPGLYIRLDPHQTQIFEITQEPVELQK